MNRPLLSGDFNRGSAIRLAAKKLEKYGNRSGWNIGGHAGDNPKQCCAYAKTTGRRCRQYSLRFRNYCKLHGGNKMCTPNGYMRRWRTNMRYSKFVGKTLSDRLRTLAADTKPIESLRDELCMMRALACDALELYTLATAIEDPTKRNAMMLSAGAHVTEALNQIRDMSYAVVKIEKESKKALDVALIGSIANQFVGAIDDVLVRYSDKLGMDPRVLAKAMGDEIYNTVMVDVTTQGTTLTPDQDVADMIATVPLATKVETNGEVHA